MLVKSLSSGVAASTGPDRIQIYIYHAGGNGGFIEQRLAFEP